MKDLFHKPSRDAYEAELNQRKATWSNLITQYYMKNIHSDVYTSIGRWILEEEGVYSPFSGVVTNQSREFQHGPEKFTGMERSSSRLFCSIILPPSSIFYEWNYKRSSQSRELPPSHTISTDDGGNGNLTNYISNVYLRETLLAESEKRMLL